MCTLSPGGKVQENPGVFGILSVLAVSSVGAQKSVRLVHRATGPRDDLSGYIPYAEATADDRPLSTTAISSE
jgi:hypothetical protein